MTTALDTFTIMKTDPIIRQKTAEADGHMAMLTDVVGLDNQETSKSASSSTLAIHDTKLKVKVSITAVSDDLGDPYLLQSTR